MKCIGILFSLGSAHCNGLFETCSGTIGVIGLEQELRLAGNQSWSDGIKAPSRLAAGMTNNTQLEVNNELCWNRVGLKECIAIHDRYLWLKPRVMVSQLTYCLAAPCSILSNNTFSLSWTMESNAFRHKEAWIKFFHQTFNANILNTSMRFFPPNQNKTFLNPSIRCLWFKPIVLVVDGVYNKTYGKHSSKDRFRAEFPLLDYKSQLLGVFGHSNFCSDFIDEFTFPDEHYSRKEIDLITSFFCHSFSH
ncbi:hypothetical protein DSO57_1029000 [Entomophthora muscae]|uniref:Uncharacterized protein n=1 Tax=Entomophthora muscae TaxID=34485 RepID=A0ACC2SQN0_9FUNG|nr:hypothetical protein DSO57_1029000 [Entomophthora muscae]